MIAGFPRPLAPGVPGFVCSNERPGAVSSWGVRRSALGPIPRRSSWAVRTASVGTASSLSRQSLPLPGGCAPRPPPESLERRFPGGGRLGRPGKRWSSAATQARALPLPQVLGLRTTSYILELCLSAAALGSSPAVPTHPAGP